MILQLEITVSLSESEGLYVKIVHPKLKRNRTSKIRSENTGKIALDDETCDATDAAHAKALDDGVFCSKIFYTIDIKIVITQRDKF